MHAATSDYSALLKFSPIDSMSQDQTVNYRQNPVADTTSYCPDPNTPGYPQQQQYEQQHNTFSDTEQAQQFQFPSSQSSIHPSESASNIANRQQIAQQQAVALAKAQAGIRARQQQQQQPQQQQPQYHQQQTPLSQYGFGSQQQYAFNSPLSPAQFSLSNPLHTATTFQPTPSAATYGNPLPIPGQMQQTGGEYLSYPLQHPQQRRPQQENVELHPAEKWGRFFGQAPSEDDDESIIGDMPMRFGSGQVARDAIGIEGSQNHGFLNPAIQFNSTGNSEELSSVRQTSYFEGRNASVAFRPNTSQTIQPNQDLVVSTQAAAAGSGSFGGVSFYPDGQYQPLNATYTTLPPPSDNLGLLGVMNGRTTSPRDYDYFLQQPAQNSAFTTQLNQNQPRKYGIQQTYTHQYNSGQHQSSPPQRQPNNGEDTEYATTLNGMAASSHAGMSLATNGGRALSPYHTTGMAHHPLDIPPSIAMSTSAVYAPTGPGSHGAGLPVTSETIAINNAGTSCGSPQHSTETATTGPHHQLQCPEPGCLKTFDRQQKLKSHMVSHKAERPFICGYCNLSFQRNHDLTRHMRLHTNEKPHKCSTCSKSFMRADALKRHSKIDHGEP